MKVTLSSAWVAIGILGYSSTFADQSDNAKTLEFDQRVSAAITAWSQSTSTYVTGDASRKLTVDAARACNTVSMRHAKLDPKEVCKTAPAAVVTYLDRSQGNRPTATLTSLIEERITGNGIVLPELVDYPTLSIVVTPPTPPDFVVTIGNVSYPSGSTTFRVTIGKMTVRVVRKGNPTCERRVEVSATGPNSVTCAL
jgi:hypothetical protein